MRADRHLADLDFCGELESPGLRIDEPGYVDYSRMPTTPDQVRIEDVLATMRLGRRRNVLHIGVGNSSLAQRLAPRLGRIDGVTVSKAEQARARSLRIPNYTTFVVSKFSQAFCTTVSGSYDVIADNNLTSFACCAYHVYRMFENYLSCLRPRGCILTDEEGLAWVAGRGRKLQRWQMSYDDLETLVARFHLTTTPLTDLVLALHRGAATETPIVMAALRAKPFRSFEQRT
jgi:hypothetical protein